MHGRLYKCFFISHKAPYTKDRMGSKFGIGSLSIVMTLLLSLVPKLEAEFTTVEQEIKSDGSISFLVIGDWGRRGLYNQSQVALQVSFFFYRIYTYIYNIPISAVYYKLFDKNVDGENRGEDEHRFCGFHG